MLFTYGTQWTSDQEKAQTQLKELQLAKLLLPFSYGTDTFIVFGNLSRPGLG